MSKTASVAVLVDLFSEAVRIARHDPRVGAAPDVVTRRTDALPKRPDLAGIIDEALIELGLQRGPIDLFVSAAAPIGGTEIVMSRPKGWTITRDALTAGLEAAGWPVGRREIVNDMFACSLAIPDLLAGGQVTPIDTKAKQGKEGFPVLVACARPQIGAMGLTPVPYKPNVARDAAPVWVPLLGEPGGLSLYPAGKAQAGAGLAARLDRYAKALSPSLAGLWTANDFLSPRGITAAYREIAGEAGAETMSPDDIGRSSTAAAAEVMESWSFMCGLWVRSLALAFGARGGIYIVGVTPLAFLTSERSGSRNRAAFAKAFRLGGPTPDYLSTIPLTLITESDPFMAGLVRLASTG